VNFLVEHSSKVLNGEEGVGGKELFYLGRRRNTKVESVGMPLIKRIGRLIKKKLFRLTPVSYLDLIPVNATNMKTAACSFSF
jgi:hypothetical protein